MKLTEIEAAIEAILFTMGDEVPLDLIARGLNLEPKITGNIIKDLMIKYEDENRGIKIIQVGEGFQLCTKKEYYPNLIEIAAHPQKPTITEVMLETLSIIAYKQPVTKAEIEKIRGVKCDHVINKLLEYDLIKELGRLDAPGKPILFGTTEEFLRSFGVEAVDELPKIDQSKLESFKAEAEEEIQLKLDV